MNTAVLIGFFIILALSPLISAPEVDPYDRYNVINYNCLHITLETQEWYALNGVNTTVMIGLFNETDGHAWLLDATGKPIIGYVPSFKYKEVITYEEYKRRYKEK